MHYITFPTARAGRPGQSLTLITPTDVTLVKAIEDMIGKKMTEYEGKLSQIS
jgi:superfamily II DNA/RNA helicase